MAYDVNSVVLSGTIDTVPSVVMTRNNKRICLFNIRTIERYQLADGRAAQHDNYFTVEALGKNVDKCLQEVQVGQRYVINGYLRVDDVAGIERTRIRVFHLQRE
jgi:single-stranded DNA-binding protein